MNHLRIGLYGHNGHQLDAGALAGLPADIVAHCGIDPSRMPTQATSHASLSSLLGAGIDAVSICSPRRSDQAGDIRAALEAGCHVLAEKPAAMTPGDLRHLLDLAAARRLVLAEMGHTGFEEPFRTLGQLAREGAAGRIRQVLVQKSYPAADFRPVDEAVDGGLLLQCALHGIRMAEWIGGGPVRQVSARQAARGGEGAQALLVDAAAVHMILDGEILGLVTANYLNPPATGRWGYEMVRVFGERAVLEAVPGEGCVRVLGDTARRIPVEEGRSDYLARVLSAMSGRKDALPPPDILFHPTFAAMEARRSARSGGRWRSLPG